MKNNIIIYFSFLILTSALIIIVKYNMSSKDYIETYIKEEKDENSIKDDYTYVEEYEIININTATKEQLMKLNGLGNKTAQNIIDYRSKNGNFKDIEELMNVKGIGKEKFKKIKKYIEV